ncbi:MAG TPA: peptidylprolyl isomerase [Aggregatilineales bacterium]|nr:peptidylprolyl isomerase [Aggregatilineales bacterium]
MKVQRILPVLLLIPLVALAACSNAPAATAPAAQVAVPSTPARASGPLDTSACANVPDPTNVQVPANGNQQRFTAPEQVVDTSHTYCAIFTTEHGRFIVELYPKYAPQNVNNFAFLAQKGFYDNIGFHRVISGFMAQTGDPTGTGSGGPGYDNIPLEVSSGLKYDSEGLVGVARTSAPNSAGSQFFITFNPVPGLDPARGNDGYTIIGKVAQGMDVVRQIRIRDVDQDPNAASIAPEKLISVRIVDLGVRSS